MKMPLATYTLLLVEDDPSSAALINAALANLVGTNFTLAFAVSLTEANNHLAAASPDVVLLDLDLPDSCGVATVLNLKCTSPPAVVVLTACDDEALALKCLEAGAQDYLVKGKFTTDSLVRAIRYAVSRAALEQRLMESEERFRLAVTGSGDGIWELNVESGQLRCSDSWQDNPAEPRVEQWGERVHADDVEAFWHDTALHFSGKTPSFINEHRMRCAGGAWRWVLARGAVVNYGAAGLPRRMIGTHTDISEYKAFSAALEQKVQQRTSALRNLGAQLVQVEMMERRALAQDLHDDIAQSLAIAQLKLSRLSTTLADSAIEAHASDELAVAHDLVARATLRVRRMMEQINPPVLHHMDIAKALRWLVDNLQSEHGLETRFGDDGLPKPLDESSRTILFRAVREALGNIVRHAGTLAAELSCLREHGQVVILVRDQGCGFHYDPERLPTPGGGFGLFNVCEQLDYIGGKVQIASAPAYGTRITFTLPLQSLAAENSQGQPARTQEL